MAGVVRVLLCGTRKDLVNEREAVLDAISRLQVPCASMESFGAQPSAPITTCLAEVRNNDIVIFIIGHMYGTMVPQRVISFSEAEYKESRRLRKQCLVYIRDEEASVIAKYTEGDPAKLKRLKRWKKTLRKNHTVGFFTTAEDLASRVMTDLPQEIHKQQVNEPIQDVIKRKRVRSGSPIVLPGPAAVSGYVFTPIGQNVFPLRISNRGQVVGRVMIGSGPKTLAFIWSKEEGLKHVGTLPPPADYGSSASAINDAGVVVGHSSEQNNNWHPFVWSPSRGMESIPTLGGAQAPPSDINASGQIVGWSSRPDRVWHAFLYSPGKGTQDLGGSGSLRSQASAINAKGWVVGNNSEHPALWIPSEPVVDLGLLPETCSGHAADINDPGEVVGSVSIPRSPSRRITVYYNRPFIWTAEKGLVALPMPNRDSASAEKINNRGRILINADNRRIRKPSEMLTSEKTGGSLGCSLVEITDRCSFIVDRGRLLELPEFPKGTDTQYFALNDNGQLVGTAVIRKSEGDVGVTVGFVATPTGNRAPERLKLVLPKAAYSVPPLSPEPTPTKGPYGKTAPQAEVLEKMRGLRNVYEGKLRVGMSIETSDSPSAKPIALPQHDKGEIIATYYYTMRPAEFQGDKMIGYLYVTWNPARLPERSGNRSRPLWSRSGFLVNTYESNTVFRVYPVKSVGDDTPLNLLGVDEAQDEYCGVGARGAEWFSTEHMVGWTPSEYDDTAILFRIEISPNTFALPQQVSLIQEILGTEKPGQSPQRLYIQYHRKLKDMALFSSSVEPGLVNLIEAPLGEPTITRMFFVEAIFLKYNQHTALVPIILDTTRWTGWPEAYLAKQ